jgi:hypothetical protein
VEVDTTNPPSTFSRAIAANGSITLSGNAVIDGYNSSLGQYDPITNRNSSGGIGTDSKDSPAIIVGTAHVYGSAVTGPGGTISSSGGSVGETSWAGPGMEPGWTDDNMNVHFLDNGAPAGPYSVPQVVIAGGSNITTLGTGTYTLSSFSSNNKKNPMVVTGQAVLYVPGDFIISGFIGNAGYVDIAPGGGLKLYVGGRAVIAGAGVINESGNPSNLSYYGLPGNTTLSYSGTANFVGTINAPEADFAISGGASVYGAVICNTFNCNGGSSVHYDQALGGGGTLVVTAWRER